jgi:hypothetical protein
VEEHQYITAVKEVLIRDPQKFGVVREVVLQESVDSRKICKSGALGV